MLRKKRKEKEKGRREKGKKEERKRFWPIYHTILKKKLKWIIDLNVRNNTIKVLGKKHRMKAEWPRIWKINIYMYIYLEAILFLNLFFIEG